MRQKEGGRGGQEVIGEVVKRKEEKGGRREDRQEVREERWRRMEKRMNKEKRR